MENQAEFVLGFFKKHIEKPKELFNFAYLSLLKKDMSKTKTYSKFKLSEQGISLLGFESNKKNQTIGFSYDLDNKIVLLVNTTDLFTTTTPNVSLLSKSGTFSNSKLYSKLIEEFELNEEKENHFKLLPKNIINNMNTSKIELIDAGSDYDIDKPNNNNTEDTIEQQVKEVSKIVSNIEKQEDISFDDIEDLPEETDEL